MIEPTYEFVGGEDDGRKLAVLGTLRSDGKIVTNVRTADNRYTLAYRAWKPEALAQAVADGKLKELST